MWLKELHFKSFLWCLLATKLLAQTTCDDVEKVKVTFYGYPDNTPPGPNIRCLLSSRSDCTGCPTNSSSSTTATHCGPRGETAGGTGTYNDPITMASAATWFCHQEVVYMPFLQKYVRYEDFCADCIGNATIGVRHIDIWTGSTTINGGRLQDKCERLLTPNTMQAMIRNPPPNLTVDGKCVVACFQLQY